MKLAVLGDPLAYTLSPVLHRAGLAALGMRGESSAIRTPVAELGMRLKALRSAGFAGVNLTIPLKEAALPHLDRISGDAERLRSVNTVGWDEAGAWGESTDGAGFLAALAREGVDPRGARVVFLGAGGAARSVAGALGGIAGSVRLATRDPARRRAALESAGLGAALGFGTPFLQAALAEASIVVRAVPGGARGGSLEPACVPTGAIGIDLAYGSEPTDWVRALRARGCRAFDGLGMLIHQARASLGLWTGREVPLGPLENAVGWPR